MQVSKLQPLHPLLLGAREGLWFGMMHCIKGYENKGRFLPGSAFLWQPMAVAEMGRPETVTAEC